MRKGFTLVETLVALVLLQFAMLAISATTAVAARDFSQARHAAAAAARARNRVAGLRADPCVPVGTQTISAGAVQERWRVTSDGPTRLIIDSVRYPRPDGTQGVAVARAVTWCAS